MIDMMYTFINGLSEELNANLMSEDINTYQDAITECWRYYMAKSYGQDIPNTPRLICPDEFRSTIVLTTIAQTLTISFKIQITFQTKTTFLI